MADNQRNLSALTFRDRVRVVGAADFNDQEGEVAWIDGDRLGVWLGHEMPVTFQRKEVVRV